MEAVAQHLTALAAQVHELLRARAESLATAESLTGGMVGAVLTEVAGASATYRGGVVVYATDLKASLLGVPAPLLAERGPVDADVAVAMADGIRSRLSATWGVALTGVAGPEAQGGRAVGTVCIAVAGPARTSVVEEVFPGDRAEVRAAACRAALHRVYDRLASGE
jgi:nicotinamide-nucleotide amidase